MFDCVDEDLGSQAQDDEVDDGDDEVDDAAKRSGRGISCRASVILCVNIWVLSVCSLVVRNDLAEFWSFHVTRRHFSTGVARFDGRRSPSLV